MKTNFKPSNKMARILIKKDYCIYSVMKFKSGESFFDKLTYEVNLKNGYETSEGESLIYCNSAKELYIVLNDIYKIRN